MFLKDPKNLKRILTFKKMFLVKTFTPEELAATPKKTIYECCKDNDSRKSRNLKDFKKKKRKENLRIYFILQKYSKKSKLTPKWM